MAGSAFVLRAHADDAKLSDKDQKYVQDDANGGMTEVMLGKLAAEKATNADVKTFAQKMVDDHTKANDQLKDLAKTKGYEIKDEGEKEQKMFDKLNKLTGDDFDKEYVNMMVKDHEKAVKEFDDESKNADDADLKKWAGDTLPTLQDHLKMIQDIQSKLGK
jgi:putative membrane protein